MLESRGYWDWGLVGLGEGAYFGLGGVAEEDSTALGAHQGRVSPRFGWGESVQDDIFDPIGMVTRMAAILGPFSRLVPGHFPEHFFQPVWLIVLGIQVLQGSAPRRRVHSL